MLKFHWKARWYRMSPYKCLFTGIEIIKNTTSFYFGITFLGEDTLDGGER